MLELSLQDFSVITRGREFSSTRKVRIAGKSMVFNRAALRHYGLEGSFGANILFNRDGGVVLQVVETEEERTPATLTFSATHNRQGTVRTKALQISRLLKQLPADRADALKKAPSLNVEATAVRDQENKRVPGNWLAVSA